MVLFILQNSTLKAHGQNISLLTEQSLFLDWILVLRKYLDWSSKTMQQITLRKWQKWGYTEESKTKSHPLKTVCPNQGYQLKSSLTCLVTQLREVFHTVCHSLKQELTALTWQDMKHLQTESRVTVCICYTSVTPPHICSGTGLHTQSPAPALPRQDGAQVVEFILARAWDQGRALPSHSTSCCRAPALDTGSYTNSKFLKQQQAQKLESGCTRKRLEHKQAPCQEWQKASVRFFLLSRISSYIYLLCQRTITSAAPAQMCDSSLTKTLRIQSEFVLWSGIGTGCAGKWLSPHHWRCSKNM